jgi:hypothetical protein
MNNLLFLPIDIDLPNLEFPKLLNTHSDIMGASFWTYEQLLDAKSDSLLPWRKDLDSIRESYKNIISKLPFETLENVRLSIQSKIVKPHIDVSDETKNKSLENYKNYLDNEPCGYRIVVSGDRSALKLIVKEDIVTAELPSIPCVYLINSTTCQHFVDQDIGRKTVYIRGKVNAIKHKNMIEKSLDKFKNYAIFFKE